MLKWKKLGLIFSPQKVCNGRPWLHEFAQGPSSLIFDDYVRIYFSCRPHPDEKGQYVSYSSYADFDRNNLTRMVGLAERPILDLGDTGCFDEFGTYPVSVIRCEETVRAYYGGWTRCESVPFNVAIGVAESRDHGKTFQRLGPGPLLSYSIDEPFVISGPKVRYFKNRWYLWYISGKKWKVYNGRPEPVYRIRMAISENGLTWNRLNRDLIPCKLEEDEAQASPDVFLDNGIFHMFFCYRFGTDFRNSQRGYRIGYAWSTDGYNWTRDDDKAGLHVSSDGWDSEMVCYPHIFSVDSQIYMAYLGNHVGREGFGLAILESEKL